jgi:hypothetical protein
MLHKVNKKIHGDFEDDNDNIGDDNDDTTPVVSPSKSYVVGDMVFHKDFPENETGPGTIITIIGGRNVTIRWEKRDEGTYAMSNIYKKTPNDRYCLTGSIQGESSLDAATRGGLYSNYPKSFTPSKRYNAANQDISGSSTLSSKRSIDFSSVTSSSSRDDPYRKSYPASATAIERVTNSIMSSKNLSTNSQPSINLQKNSSTINNNARMLKITTALVGSKNTSPSKVGARSLKQSSVSTSVASVVSQDTIKSTSAIRSPPTVIQLPKYGGIAMGRPVVGSSNIPKSLLSPVAVSSRSLLPPYTLETNTFVPSQNKSSSVNTSLPSSIAPTSIIHATSRNETAVSSVLQCNVAPTVDEESVVSSIVDDQSTRQRLFNANRYNNRKQIILGLQAEDDHVQVKDKVKKSLLDIEALNTSDAPIDAKLLEVDEKKFNVLKTMPICLTTYIKFSTPPKGFWVFDENNIVTLKPVEPVYQALMYLSRRVLSSNHESFNSKQELMTMIQFIIGKKGTEEELNRKGHVFKFMYKLCAGNHLHNLVHQDFFSLIAGSDEYKSRLTFYNKKLSLDGYNCGNKLFLKLKDIVFSEDEANILMRELDVEVNSNVSFREQLIEKIKGKNLNGNYVGQFIIDKYLYELKLITAEMRVKHSISANTTLIKGFDYLTSASDEAVLKAYAYITLFKLYTPTPKKKSTTAMDISQQSNISIDTNMNQQSNITIDPNIYQQNNSVDENEEDYDDDRSSNNSTLQEYIDDEDNTIQDNMQDNTVVNVDATSTVSNVALKTKRFQKNTWRNGVILLKLRINISL